MFFWFHSSGRNVAHFKNSKLKNFLVHFTLHLTVYSRKLAHFVKNKICEKSTLQKKITSRKFFFLEKSFPKCAILHKNFYEVLYFEKNSSKVCYFVIIFEECFLHCATFLKRAIFLNRTILQS